MKKVLAILLALIFCVSIFAACGEAKEPASANPGTNNEPSKTDDSNKTEDPGKTEEPGKAEDPATPDSGETKLKAGLSSDGKTFVGILDKTDDYTLVIEKVNAVGDDRIGVKSTDGKVEIGHYNASGTRRMQSYELDWASLGLEGLPYEYLGSTFVLDVSDPDNIKVTNTPKKATYVVTFADVKIGGQESLETTTYEMPDGYKFNLSDLHYGIVRPNNLLNEGGKFVTGWNDKSVNTPNLFIKEESIKNYYYMTAAELYNKFMICPHTEAPMGYTGTLSPNDQAK